MTLNALAFFWGMSEEEMASFAGPIYDQYGMEEDLSDEDKSFIFRAWNVAFSESLTSQS